MIPLGISFCSSALVGSYLGEYNVKLAKRFAIFTIALVMLVTSLIVNLIYFCPRQIFSIITN
jgi:Na+-driven multidrug efflux pump